MSPLLPEIKEITDIIVREYDPDKIILFGSRARGEGKPDSDIDILVVSDREKDIPRYKRGQNVRLKLAGISVPLDILFYTHDDLNRFKNIRQSFCATVRREGVELYGKGKE
jgi:uncharacterized protein